MALDQDWYNSLPHISWPTHCLICQIETSGSQVNKDGLMEAIPCGHVNGTYKVKPNA